MITLALIATSVSSVGEKTFAQDTIPKDTGKTVIIVTKDNFKSVLDSIKTSREDSITKYAIKNEKLDSKIDRQIKELDGLEKKNQSPTKSKKRVFTKKKVVKSQPEVIEKDSIQSNVVKEDSTQEKKKSWFKRIFNFKKQKDENSKTQTK